MRILLRTALAVTVLALCALLLEGGLRLFAGYLPQPFLVFVHRDLANALPAVMASLRRSSPYAYVHWDDADLGWVLTPGLTLEGVNEDGEGYTHTVSSQGLLTPDTPAADVEQVALIGDSFLSTYWVPEPAPWVLRREIGLPTYNVAVGGWGPGTYLEAYRRFVRGRRAKVAVFTFLNDISDVQNWREWQATARDLSFGAWLQRNNPNDDPINVHRSWLDRRSLLWNYLRYGARLLSHPAMAAQPDAPAVSPAIETFGHGNASFSLQLNAGYPFLSRDPAAFQPGGDFYQPVADYLRALETLRAEMAADGVEMLLVWVPAKERVYVPLLPPDRQRRYVTNATGRIDGLEIALTAYAAQRGVPLLNLAEAFDARARAGEKLFFTRDGHLNAHGNAMMGQLAARFIASPPPPPAAPGLPPVLVDETAVEVGEPLALDRTTFLAPIAARTPAGLTVRGVPASRFAYLAAWPPRHGSAPPTLLVRGVLRAGRISLGIIRTGGWGGQVAVNAPGPFSLAIPASGTGPYAATIAANLEADGAQVDFDITSIGWARSSP